MLASLRQFARGSARELFAVRRGDLAAPAKRCYQLAAALCVFALPALLVDLPVARYVREIPLFGDLRRLLNWSEVFAHGLGVGLVALVVVALDSARRRYWLRILCMAYGGGLLADVVKLLIARFRPHHFLQLDVHGPWSATVWGTFAGPLPWAWRENGLDHAIQSFPSAHTATAVGFAVGLWRVYPRARWLFVCLALLAAAQRIETGAHFVSDVLVGAAVGLVAAGVALDPRLLADWFERLESPRRPTAAS